MAHPVPISARLAELTIRDFAIVETLRIEWRPGLTVITGETGAGKSIIIDALGAALGDRSAPDWIRTGAERASVEAIFAVDPEDEQLHGLLDELGANTEDGSLILTRDVWAGRSVSRVNGRAVPVSTVQQLAERLVDVHSQASHLSLLRPREHLGLLDRYAHLAEPRAAMAAVARSLAELRREIRRLDEDERAAQREAVLLRHEVDEIDAAAVQPDEEDELTARRARLKNALRLQQLVRQAHDALNGSEESSGALDLLSEAAGHLDEIGALDPGFGLTSARLIEVIDAAQDVERHLSRYAETVEQDPDALEALEERALLLADLKRKYGPTLKHVLAYRERSAKRLGEIEHREERITELQARETEVMHEAAQVALQLCQARSAAAQELQGRVERELEDLGMGGTRFVVALNRRPDPQGIVLEGGGPALAFDETGVDQVEFLISPNPGEQPRPLARIASGGELARFMLALKSVLSTVDETPVLIFDELDQGVGGRIGHVIGEKLWQLSRGHHVLCITHLPQVACYGDVHFSVTKEVEGGRTATRVSVLEPEERIDELAAMLAGAQAGPAARRSAEELLSRAAEWKSAQR